MATYGSGVKVAGAIATGSSGGASCNSSEYAIVNVFIVTGSGSFTFSMYVGGYLVQEQTSPGQTILVQALYIGPGQSLTWSGLGSGGSVSVSGVIFSN